MFCKTQACFPKSAQALWAFSHRFSAVFQNVFCLRFYPYTPQKTLTPFVCPHEKMPPFHSLHLQLGVIIYPLYYTQYKTTSSIFFTHLIQALLVLFTNHNKSQRRDLGSGLFGADIKNSSSPSFFSRNYPEGKTSICPGSKKVLEITSFNFAEGPSKLLKVINSCAPKISHRHLSDRYPSLCCFPDSPRLERNRITKGTNCKPTVKLSSWLLHMISWIHPLQVLSIGTKGASFVQKENHKLSPLGAEGSLRLCHRSKRKPGCSFRFPGLWNSPLPVPEGCCCTSEVNKSKGYKDPSLMKKGPSPHFWGLSEVQHAKFKSI